MSSYITSSSPWLYVTNNGNSYVSNNGQSAGSVRFNTSTQQLEAYDGYSWLPVISNTTVGMSPMAEEVLTWGATRMQQEREWEKLAESNQAVKIALDNVNQARAQLDVIAKLAREYETTS